MEGGGKSNEQEMKITTRSDSGGGEGLRNRLFFASTFILHPVADKIFADRAIYN